MSDAPNVLAALRHSPMHITTLLHKQSKRIEEGKPDAVFVSSKLKVRMKAVLLENSTDVSTNSDDLTRVMQSFLLCRSSSRDQKSTLRT